MEKTEQKMTCTYCKGEIDTESAFCPHCGKAIVKSGKNGEPVAQPVEQKSRLIAGLLAIFVGYLGVHNFYLGQNFRGWWQVLVSILGAIPTLGLSLIFVYFYALAEGIVILAGIRKKDGKGIPLKN